MSKKLADLLKNSNFIKPEYSWKIRLLQIWPSLSNNFKDKVSIEKIENKLLVIGVSHPTWAQELNFFSDILKEKINTALKGNFIEKIHFKVRSNKEKTIFKKNIKEQKQNKDIYKEKRVFLTVQEEKSLNKISDQNLKSFMKDFYLRCKRGSS